jgi:ATPases of the AAA+ class
MKKEVKEEMKSGGYNSNVEYLRDQLKLLEIALDKDKDRREEMQRSMEKKKRLAKRTFEFDSFIKEYSLDEVEESMVLLLLKYDLDPEEEPIGKDVIATVCKLMNLEPLEVRKYLYENGKLLSNGIVLVEEEGSTVLSSVYSLNEWVIRRILGQEMNYSQIDWNEATEWEKSDKKDVFCAIDPKVSLNDVVLTKELQEKIEEALAQIKYHHRIFESWGAKEKFNKSLTFLFYGPPGTGKTFTAEAIAKELGKKLYMIDYPRLMSMWLGNTEKNIEKCFKEAKDAILFFDEADALVRDRNYMSLSGLYESVNVLLSQLDRFEGIVIFATNQASMLDKALDRRLNLKVYFDLPGEKERELLWKEYIPKNLPADVDIKTLAREFNMSGAQIKNAVMGAMRKGASKNFVSMSNFVRASEEELRNLNSTIKNGSHYL